MPRWIKIGLWVVAILVIGLIAIQFVPYGREHTNPPVTNRATFADARTAQLVKGACFDCHSNETVWPWYSSIAPASWLVYNDVQEGRENLNFSEWPATGGSGLMLAASQIVREGEMPPIQYKLAHSSARLSDEERKQLADGLRASGR